MASQPADALPTSGRVLFRGFAGVALAVLAIHRVATALGHVQSGDAGDSAGHQVERRLEEPLPLPEDEEVVQAAQTQTCSRVPRGLPIQGVRYIPHLVGEPYPHPESKPMGYYTETYGGMHSRDLPLIGERLAADTLNLRPWPTDGPVDEQVAFFSKMRSTGICKVIPTFQAAKFYADMLREGFELPKTDPSSPFAVNFIRFGATVTPEVLGDIDMVGWTIDLSLDLHKLLPLVTTDCTTSKVTQEASFQKYMQLLNAIQEWVHPASGSSVAPALSSAPFMVPLDISRVSWTEPQFRFKLNTFLRCMSTETISGGWSNLFSTQSSTKARWLLSFSQPLHQEITYNFRFQLHNISAESNHGIVVMLGTQALVRGGANPINMVNLQEDLSPNDARYRLPYEDYLIVQNETGNLDGFIWDEWMDDWDRGTRGPFYLATDTLEAMKDPCPNGGRFSHDINGCGRVVGNSGHVYPEFFGLAATSSQILRHCVHPRFSRGLFGADAAPPADGVSWSMEKINRSCSRMLPSKWWTWTAVFLLALVMALQMCRMILKWYITKKDDEQRGESKKDNAVDEVKEERIGYVDIRPTEKVFFGEHVIELRTRRLRSNEEAGWWLWSHVASQMAILEKQVHTERAAGRAIRDRQKQHPLEDRAGAFDSEGSAQSAEEVDADPATRELVKAMQIVHRRTLEGFAAWCTYVAGVNRRSCCRNGCLDPEVLRDYARGVEENTDRPPSRLFVEALLLRTMESLGELILQCPERLSYLLFHILQEAGGLEDNGPAFFTIDLDKLQDGLIQMNINSNPYVKCKMPDGKWELGLNFDDINESGIQCRPGVVKTFKEPSSLMVVIDFVLCYRVPFMLKLYCLCISGYIYLGAHNGDDISTSHNGDPWQPKWLRINYLQYTAILDGLVWALLEFSVLAYFGWQRWPSVCHRSPGVPGAKWLLEHFFNLVASAAGCVWVYSQNTFRRKPWECAQSDIGICEDERTVKLFNSVKCALIYWGCRIVIFIVMNVGHRPIFLYGTPDSKVRTESGRGQRRTCKQDMKANVTWFFMLGACIALEVLLLLPTMKGLDWSTTCGMDLFGEISGLPFQSGMCTEPDRVYTYGCISCLSSVSAGWLLVVIGSMVDIYFVFYLASAVVGSYMGHKRHLNDLKNTSLPIDLNGREADLFERTFGPGWRSIWRVMVNGLLQESFISPKQAAGLVQAAGIELDEERPPTHREKPKKPIHLTRFPQLAAERLAFFFQSLKWIPGSPAELADGMGFLPTTDALTGPEFDVGSIPSLTQIIPAYNEVVIPAVDFLKSGSEPEDARNGSPDDQPGLGDLTVPPQGDGVNTNLAFMISQFPDEWVFFAKRLHSESRIDTCESQALYRAFITNMLSPDLITEVRLWAALRMQSVAKTVIGALQYGRALASLQKIKDYYSQFPEKRVPEDHVEVILAHQTYGHPDGSVKNDEAVQLLLERHADDALYLVFDLKKDTSAELWNMVETHLSAKGGYVPGCFQQASVKCRWDKGRRGLRVLEVLPRKFPLRLGQGDYRTQGKACNQLNGLRFASGHYVQALDCNMGTFIGEGFKVPYVLRMFMPLDKEDRTAPLCRYLGFREYIYTGREGTVGKCHAAAEWTFGTIYQRFLSGMGMRMHYGHPDFLDGFWARNRGGMSKSSPVVNLSEDIFAGFNVRMREEASPHIDALEFEKGREATFNAASNFFSKISGGSVAVIRSRDNHLLCERIGVLHSLSFYFTSVAFYTSNLLVDFSIYLYVILFIFFNLTGMGPGELSALGSTFSTEWIVSMGLVTLVPQLCEMVLEYGAVHAIREVLGGIVAATFFYIFQNKNIASSMREGAMSGIARYFFTGRPPANQHQTWKDIYVTYWTSHYRPAMHLATAYVIYFVLAMQNHSKGKLPMALVIVSFTAWVVTPILFSPFPRWNLILQDLREFNSFICGGAGTQEVEIPDVVARGKKGNVRSLYECGLSHEFTAYLDSPLMMLHLCFVVKLAMLAYLATALPAGVLDFMPIYLVALSFSWVWVLGYCYAGLNNVFLVISFLSWPATIPFAHNVIGSRFSSPTPATRMPEYIISLAFFLFTLGCAKDFILLSCRTVHYCFSSKSSKSTGLPIGRLHDCVRICFVYFFVHQLQVVEAYLVLTANTTVSGVLAGIDQVFCNAHTWFLLNTELSRTRHGERYMQKNTFYEQDGPASLDIWGPDSDSEGGTPRARGHGRDGEDSIPNVRTWA